MKICKILKVRGIDKKSISIIENEITKVCNSYPLVKNLKKVTFILDGKKTENPGGIDLNRLIKGENNVKIYVHSYLKKKRFDKKDLKFTLIHELTHIWHYNNSKEVRRILLKLKKLKPSYFKKLYEFITNLYFESFAVFRTHRDYFLFTKKHFLKEYKKKKKIVENIKTKFNQAIKSGNFKKFIKYIDGTQYKLGSHMLYTILFVDKKARIRNLIKNTFEEFIIIYEKSIKKLKLKPLVSLKSNKGVFDYDNTLKRLRI